MSEKQYQTKVKTLLKQNGWLVHTTYESRHVNPKGFPDLMAWKPLLQRILFAELKDTKGTVTAEQKEVLEGLALIPGVETYIWYPLDWPKVYEIVTGEKLPVRKWYIDRNE